MVNVFISVAMIVCVHLDIWPAFSKTHMLRSHVMCGSFGMLGATLAAMRKFYRTLITESTAKAASKPVIPAIWDFGWVYYYLTRPVLGGILGALTYTLSFVGFHVLAAQPDVKMSAEGRYLLCALSFVSGFSVSHALDRLNVLAKQFFQAERTPKEQ